MMRRSLRAALGLSVALALAGCAHLPRPEVARADPVLDVIDESNLATLMLTVADPAEAVAYFRRASGDKPGRIDLQRGLAQSLGRAGNHTEAALAWARVVALPGASDADRVAEAAARVRAGDWDGARAALAALPDGHQSYERLRLEAMMADGDQAWARADQLYAAALPLAPEPAGLLNNWGFSRLSRGDYRGAEQLFTEALSQDPALFTAKNNLVLARGAQRIYHLPALAMTQTERAQLLHTLALAAVRQGDLEIARVLLQDAITTHPQYFEEAARALRALGPAAG